MQHRKQKKVSPFPGHMRISEPNKEELARLTLLAKGEKRSLREFATACGVSTSTLSRVINIKSDSNTPNSDNLIEAIAKNADPDSGVTLEMLLVAHGIAPILMADIDSGSVGTSVVFPENCVSPKYQKVDDEIISANNGSQRSFSMVEKICREVLEYELMRRGYEIQSRIRKNLIIKTDKLRYISDFAFETNAVEQSGMKMWAFDVHVGRFRPIMQKLTWVFGMSYLESLREKQIKFSLITTDAKEFETVKDRFEDVTIPDLISVIYIDINNRRVVEEFTIPTQGNIDSIFKEEA